MIFKKEAEQKNVRCFEHEMDFAWHEHLQRTDFPGILESRSFQGLGERVVEEPLPALLQI